MTDEQIEEIRRRATEGGLPPSRVEVLALLDALRAAREDAERLAEALYGVCDGAEDMEPGDPVEDGPCWSDCPWPHRPACEQARAALAAHLGQP